MSIVNFTELVGTIKEIEEEYEKKYLGRSMSEETCLIIERNLKAAVSNVLNEGIQLDLFPSFSITTSHSLPTGSISLNISIEEK